jgi:hypothetical protein
VSLIKIEKENFLSIIEILDHQAEITPLDEEEKKIMHNAQDEVAK